MLRVRLITALGLLPLILGAFIYGASWFVALFLLLCVTLSLLEGVGMLLPAFEHRLAGVPLPTDREAPPWKKISLKGQNLQIATLVLGWALFLVAVFGSREPDPSLMSLFNARGSHNPIGLIVIFLMASLMVGVFSSRDIDRAAARAFAVTLSLVWTVLPWLVIWDLYLMGDHARYILLVLAITWLGDTGGYFGGRFLGGKIFGDRKMAPVISPKKTWEGGVAGLLMSVAGALIFNGIFKGELASWPVIAVTGLVAGTAGQMGDLVESTFKRFSGVKDSGALLPGHGGFFDRVDAILFSAPVIWFILYYFR